MNKDFLLGERYRLELHWGKVKYDVDQIAVLEGCYFSGPVIKDVQQLNQKDYMDLDFANQYIIFVDFYYIARLFWEGVKHTPEKIFLNNVILKNRNLNVVPKLTNNDYIVIDTKDHEDVKHANALVYPSFLVKENGQFYNFREMK